jgi:hypothetical protein
LELPTGLVGSRRDGIECRIGDDWPKPLAAVHDEKVRPEPAVFALGFGVNHAILDPPDDPLEPQEAVRWHPAQFRVQKQVDLRPGMLRPHADTRQSTQAKLS